MLLLFLIQKMVYLLDIDAINLFVSLAESNTESNVETLGLLCHKRVSHKPFIPFITAL